MKRLLDESLLDRVVPLIPKLYSGSSHVKQQDLVRMDVQAAPSLKAKFACNAAS